MNRFCAALLVLFVASLMVGCGGESNTVATQDEMKATRKSMVTRL